MSEQFEPHRQPIAECLAGVVSRVDDMALLSSSGLPEGEEIARGDLIGRYGITYLGKPHLSIVPDLVVADYGELIYGEAAWHFLMTLGHLYPRADVCGLRNDGQDEMLVLKQLDFDYPYDVFVYKETTDRQPIARLTGLIAVDLTNFPGRLVKHLPTFASLDAWRTHG